MHESKSPRGARQRVEHALRLAVRDAVEDAPPRLARAIEHAVFPGGARLRPLLCIEVAEAHGDPFPDVTTAAAIAIELLHCASLVHDDMPCFDDADTRRGRPSVHRRFDVPTAVLVGDALIVMAFDVLGGLGGLESTSAAPSSSCVASLVCLLGRAAGASRGLVAGQAWELEPCASIERVHRAKTASLFEAAARAGAMASRGRIGEWGEVGLKLGELYQIADDLADATASASSLGKPVGQDTQRGRPSIVRSFGLEEARRRLTSKLEEAIVAIPSGPHAEGMANWVRVASGRLFNRSAAPSLPSALPAPADETRVDSANEHFATRVG